MPCPRGCASAAVLNCESLEASERFGRKYFDRFQPADERESNLVERIVQCFWRQHHPSRMEASPDRQAARAYRRLQQDRQPEPPASPSENLQNVPDTPVASPSHCASQSPPEKPGTRGPSTTSESLVY